MPSRVKFWIESCEFRCCFLCRFDFWEPSSAKIQLENRTNFLVYFHPNDDWKSLHEFLPPAILPQEYGGHLKQNSMINLLEDVENLEKHFGELFRFGYVKNQKLRQSLRLIKSSKDSKLS